MLLHGVAGSVLLVAASAAGQPPGVVTLHSASDPKQLVTIDLSDAGKDAQTIHLGQGSGLPGSGQVGTIACRHALDLNRLRNASLALLRSHRLRPSAYEVEGQLVVVTDPRIAARRASYYVFTAAMAPCAGTCSLSVSAWKMVAPFDGSYIVNGRAARQNDDITGDLFDVGETEFNKCA